MIKKWDVSKSINSFLVLVCFLIFSSSVQAGGLLVASGSEGGKLKVEEHSVKVMINNGIAVTEVTQIFRNLENRQVEALYTFPVPKGATVSNFSMWIQGKEMIGEVVEKKRAREIYESYKAKRVDPGLLEQVDFKRFEMRIFPIAAKAEQKVVIVYYQELDVDNDWISYVYPLETVAIPGLESKTSNKFSLNMEILSGVPITEMKSSSHNSSFAINKVNQNFYHASLEVKEGDLNKDVVLSCLLARANTGVDLITSKTSKEDGYFYLTITSGEDGEKLDKGSDYVFVLDISGSMINEGKLAQSRKTINSFINLLGEKDRFELITFNTMPESLFNKLTTPSPEAMMKFQNALKNLQARGGTSIEPALNLAYKYANPEKNLNIIILSDGIDQASYPKSLIDLMKTYSSSLNARTFCVGVGNEVNKSLLNRIAQESGGFAAFISNGDDFNNHAELFFKKLMKPIAKNLVIKFEGVEVYDVYPKKLPDLYHGFPVRVYGRYKGSGDTKVKFSADFLDRKFSKNLEMNLPDFDDSNTAIERMWAFKKLETLVNELPENVTESKEINEIVRLGEAYSIVSEYTSFLVLENNEEFKRWNIERRNVLRMTRDNKAITATREKMDDLRKKATDSLGPLGERSEQKESKSEESPIIDSKANNTNNTATPVEKARQPQRERNNSRDFFGGGGGGGGGPVAPVILFGVIGVYLMRKRKK
jgi:Ca-activated chloride channel family protein